MAIGAGSDPEIHKRVSFSWFLVPGTWFLAPGRHLHERRRLRIPSCEPGSGAGFRPLARGLVAQLVRARA
jgi:hypothetical protein